MRKVSLLFMRFYPGLYSVKRYESIAAMTFDYHSDLERKTEISVTSRRLKFSKVGGNYRLHVIPTLIPYVIRFTRAIELTITYNIVVIRSSISDLCLDLTIKF